MQRLADNSFDILSAIAGYDISLGMIKYDTPAYKGNCKDRNEKIKNYFFLKVEYSDYFWPLIE